MTPAWHGAVRLGPPQTTRHGAPPDERAADLQQVLPPQHQREQQHNRSSSFVELCMVQLRSRGQAFPARAHHPGFQRAAPAGGGHPRHTGSHAVQSCPVESHATGARPAPRSPEMPGAGSFGSGSSKVPAPTSPSSIVVAAGGGSPAVSSCGGARVRQSEEEEGDACFGGAAPEPLAAARQRWREHTRGLVGRLPWSPC